jgi:hypothetical protein
MEADNGLVRLRVAGHCFDFCRNQIVRSVSHQAPRRKVSRPNGSLFAGRKSTSPGAKELDLRSAKILKLQAAKKLRVSASTQHLIASRATVCLQTPLASRLRLTRAVHGALKRDEIRMNHHRALDSCLGMIFSENRFTLFRIMP